MSDKVSKENHSAIPPVMPSLSRFVKDGEDHINIWERGETELGKFLAHGTNAPFKHPVFGMFSNIECFWLYIRSEERDDRIRVLNSLSAKKFSENFTLLHVPNFYAVIMDANWHKVQQHPNKLELLKNNTLPLEMYYLYKNNPGVKIRPVFASWVLQGFEEIKNALKENRDPNFKFLMKEPTDDLYTPLINLRSK